MTTGSAANMAPPTAEELMMLLDGELLPGRAEEVWASVAGHPAASQLLADMHLAGGLLAEEALASAEGAGADSIVDQVMSRIEVAPERRARSNVIRARFGVGGVLAAAAAWLLFAQLRPVRDGAKLPAPGDELSSVTQTEVEAIDFGDRAGTLFYVSGSTSNMAVVWVTDDDEPSPSGETQ